MANPKVRPYLSFLPEDSGSRLSEARQNQRWLNEMDPDHLTPMVRVGTDRDYYVFEPALLKNGEAVIPVRWFTWHGDIYALVWKMESVVSDSGGGGWIVRENVQSRVALTDFSLTYPEFLNSHLLKCRNLRRYSLPSSNSLMQDSLLHHSSR
jgi:hypothetical protein